MVAWPPRSGDVGRGLGDFGGGAGDEGDVGTGFGQRGGGGQADASAGASDEGSAAVEAHGGETGEGHGGRSGLEEVVGGRAKPTAVRLVFAVQSARR